MNPLDSLFVQLEAAIAAGDDAEAHRLIVQIEQLLDADPENTQHARQRLQRLVQQMQLPVGDSDTINLDDDFTAHEPGSGDTGVLADDGGGIAIAEPSDDSASALDIDIGQLGAEDTGFNLPLPPRPHGSDDSDIVLAEEGDSSLHGGPGSADDSGIVLVDDDFTPESPSPAGPGTVYPVWFGTNRQPAEYPDQGFTTARSRETTLGRVDVFIPEAHRFGELGNNWWTRLRRFDLRDDRLRVQRIQRQDATTFWAELQQEMHEARAAGSAPHALVFLHGYNVDFAEAAIRAAQIGFDLKVPGTTAMFSWPSLGTFQGYPADEASIEASEGAITRFLVDFVTQSGAEKVHLIAHSMGNRGLLRALQRIAASAQKESPIRFGQIFLAAPDVDRDLFLELAHLYPQFSDRTTLYASNGDRAVYVSALLHSAYRAGYFEPYTVAAGIDTIAVPDFDIDHLGHSYFAQAESLLYDIFSLMKADEPPHKRGPRIRPATHKGLAFWELQR